MAIIRFNPMRELLEVEREFSKLFNKRRKPPTTKRFKNSYE